MDAILERNSELISEKEDSIKIECKEGWQGKTSSQAVSVFQILDIFPESRSAESRENTSLNHYFYSLARVAFASFFVVINGELWVPLNQPNFTSLVG